MTKLHEVLAIEPDLEGTAKKVVKEAEKSFERPGLFIGFERVWEMFAEQDQNQAPPLETQHMETTVPEKLRYVATHLSRYYDSVLTKERANQQATADLEVDGVVLIKNAPATFLLGIENKLKALRGMFDKIPTLPAGIEWKEAKDLGEHTYRTAKPEIRFKTAKTFQHKVLVPAQFPKEGEGGTSLPAQIERWEETVNVGQSVKTLWMGMVPSAKKSEIIGRLDRLIQACKKARQRANDIEIKRDRISESLFKYIIG